jgi:benzoyl-CoA reductase/2-hydroxyglutaryl-CoA dehydratase subunit BcrC/BadD/HgdB
VLPLLGAFWRVEPEHYAALATEAAREIERRPSSAGPRVLLAGAPVDGPALHAGIESRGAIVVAETGPWGSGAAGDDIDCGGDPIAALSEKYCNAAIGPRTPAIAIRNAIARNLDDVDAVVLSLPPEDTVFGWDYPALRSLFEAKHIPHVCLGGEPNEPLSDSDSTRLDALMAAAETGMEARHG